MTRVSTTVVQSLNYNLFIANKIHANLKSSFTLFFDIVPVLNNTSAPSISVLINSIGYMHTHFRKLSMASLSLTLLKAQTNEGIKRYLSLILNGCLNRAF